MGWYFRRSLGIGPLRLNFSKRGVGWSVGGRGFRTGVDASGRQTTSTTIPGTGLGYRTRSGRASGARGCLFVLCAGALLVVGATGLGAAIAVMR